MTRKDLQLLSKTRLKEARALLDAGLFDGAYYVCGYAVECALKACIAKRTRRYSFPDKALANQAYQHNLVELVKAAELKAAQDGAFRASPSFHDNWNIVKDWTPECRYELGKSEQEARDILSACSSRRHGVLSWLAKQW